MTQTAERPEAPLRRGAQAHGETGPVSESHAVSVPAPPRARRRWGLFAAMAALVCVGALGNVWLHQATSNAQQVVAARVTIERGSVITREELMSVEVGADPALRTVPASQLESLVGQRAAVDVAAGSLFTGESVTTKNLPAQGSSLVGIAVTSAMMPGAELQAGDRIRVVATPGQQAEATDSGSPVAPVAVAAVVVSAVVGSDATGQGAQTIITVQVPAATAPELAAMAATGRVAIVLDSRDR